MNSLLSEYPSKTFNLFCDSEKVGGILLLLCIMAAITMANAPIDFDYLNLWNKNLAGMSLKQWINDGLMAIFFLLIGLELKREIYIGELSNVKSALLPICAAIGGMLVPALIHFSLNQATDTQNGIGIPMATDIAFTIGVLAILGNRIPASLKVFVVAFAVIDDLGAILTIVFFYTSRLLVWYVIYALAVWILLIMLNRLFRVRALLPYIVGGILMWFFILKSGIHPTVAGIMLAFAIPFSDADDDQKSPSYRLEHLLQKPVAFIILPIFALANTGIIFGQDWLNHFSSLNSIGIAMGLVIGKPLGITIFCFIAVTVGLSRLPLDLRWGHIIGAGMLGGIGLTMSIFITNLAFHDNLGIINASKMAVLMASLTAGILGFLVLKFMKQTGGGSSLTKKLT